MGVMDPNIEKQTGTQDESQVSFSDDRFSGPKIRGLKCGKYLLFLKQSFKEQILHD